MEMKHGDPIILRTRAGRFLNSPDGVGPEVLISPTASHDLAISDEIWWVERVDGNGAVQHGDAILLRTRAGRFLNSPDGVGPEVLISPTASHDLAISDEVWWIDLQKVPIDGNVPVFPIVKEAFGARGYARITVEADGASTLYMKVDVPANGDTTRYWATVLITGYKDNDFNNVLTDRIETHSLTVGSNPFNDSDKDESWIISSVSPEDANNIRHIHMQLVRDEVSDNILEQFIVLCREIGEAWDAGDSLYKKVKHSQLGEDFAVALALA